MKGRRIAVPANGNIFEAVKEAGDYCGPVEGTAIKDGKKVTVQRVSFLLPDVKTGCFIARVRRTSSAKSRMGRSR